MEAIVPKNVNWFVIKYFIAVNTIVFLNYIICGRFESFAYLVGYCIHLRSSVLKANNCKKVDLSHENINISIFD